MGAGLQPGGALSKRRTRRRSAVPMSEINVTPMVDVMLVLLVALYLSADFAVSFAVGLSSGLRCVGWLMLVFPTLHVSYGMGYVRGIFDFLIRRKRPDIAVNTIPLSR